MASLRVISSSSGKRIEPEWPTSFAEESKNSSIGAKMGIKEHISQIKYGGLQGVKTAKLYRWGVLKGQLRDGVPPHLIRLFLAVAICPSGPVLCHRQINTRLKKSAK